MARRRQFWKVLTLPSTSPSQGVLPGPAGGREFGRSLGGSWGKEGVLGRVVGRDGLIRRAEGAASGGCQWTLGARGLTGETWAHPALPAPPPSPCHPPPCRPPEQKAEAGRAVLTGGWAPGSECGLPAARVRRTHPRHRQHLGGSWVQELGSAKAAQDRRAEARCSASSSPGGWRQSPPSSPRFSKNEAGSKSEEAFLPRKSQCRPAPPPKQTPSTVR